MIIFGIIAIFILAVVALLAITATRRTTQGRLSRETRSRDAAAHTESTSTELEAIATAEGRARSEESQGAAAAGVPAMRGETAVTTWTPADEEELGVSRRQFLNRANLSVIGIGTLPVFGVSLIAFLYPGKAGGFGAPINIGKISDIVDFITNNKQPFYAAQARTYVQLYPADDSILKNAGSAYEGPENVAAMGLDQGLVALFQTCPHLGCRVPWCASSQWFECPCHGSKYNKVGEKKDGPAPRGMDRFAIDTTGGNLTVLTGTRFQGPPIGTDTTGQKPEGPACV